MSLIEQHIDEPTILITEDDLSLRFLIVESLLKAGFNVEEASNGEECLDKLSNIIPDIIVLDVLMPKKNGFDTCETIKTTQRFKHTPVLMMTGLEDELSINTSYEVGATDFIQKPFNFNLFIQRLRYINRNSKMTQELIESKRRIQQAHEIVKLAYWEWEHQSQRLTCSKSLFDLLGINASKHHNNFNFLLEHTVREDKSNLAYWLNSAIEGHPIKGIRYQITSAKGNTLHVYQQVKQNYDENGQLSHLYGSLIDVTEIHNANEKIRQLAYFDELTQLPNRTFLQEQLTTAIHYSLMHDQPGSLLIITINNISSITNTLGHSCGENIIQEIALRIKRTLENIFRHNQHIDFARLADDKFAVLYQGLPNKDKVQQLSKAIINSCSKPFIIEKNEISALLSIGIALFPNDAESAESCIRKADLAAVYASNNKPNFSFFNTSMNKEIQERNFIEKGLRHAIINDELKLVYQPQVDLSSGEIYGVEALIRWQSPELGLVSPTKFIPIAEESNIIVEIGEWALRTACQQAKQWLTRGIAIKRIAVNVSIRQFSQMNFIDVVSSIIEETRLPAKFLELEITESLLMSEADTAIKILKTLKKLGLKLSIDDFGTGYSSLAYLKHFPIDHLKIDRAFIQDMNENQSNTAIVSAVIAMAKSIGLRVTAEGVENRKQLKILQQSGCTEVQGYYFSKPLPAYKFEELYDAKKCLL